jgi:hypothetical protein
MVHYVIEFSVHETRSQENNIPCGEPDEAILFFRSGEVDESENRTFYILIRKECFILGDMALGQESVL